MSWTEIPVRAGVRSQWHSFRFEQRTSPTPQPSPPNMIGTNLDLLLHAFSIDETCNKKTPILELVAPSKSGLVEKYKLSIRTRRVTPGRPARLWLAHLRYDCEEVSISNKAGFAGATNSRIGVFSCCTFRRLKRNAAINLSYSPIHVGGEAAALAKSFVQKQKAMALGSNSGTNREHFQSKEHSLPTRELKTHGHIRLKFTQKFLKVFNESCHCS